MGLAKRAEWPGLRRFLRSLRTAILQAPRTRKQEGGEAANSAGHGRFSKRTPRSSHMFLCSQDVSEFMLHA